MSYSEAKAKYAALGADTEAAIEKLLSVPVSLHCWQGDDVIGFDNGGGLTGGIQTTGNYPGRARTPAELMADIDEVLRLVPGRMKLNLHACYAIFCGARAGRDALRPEHFAPWAEFAKEIFSLAGIRQAVQPCTTEEFPRPAPRPRNSRLDKMRLRMAGLPPMPHWKDALGEFMRTEFGGRGREPGETR